MSNDQPQTTISRVSQAIFGCPENATREDIAKAAILATLDAIREPTEAMLKQAYWSAHEENAAGVWEEMIEALKSEVANVRF